MKHCIKFEPIDIWFLHDNDKFLNRKLSFGICPVCNKPIAILIQYDISQKKFVSVKKIGFSSQKFVTDFKKQVKISASQINKQKFKPTVYGWVYGLNKQSKNYIKQYANDFFGNKIIIKKFLSS